MPLIRIYLCTFTEILAHQLKFCKYVKNSLKENKIIVHAKTMREKLNIKGLMMTILLALKLKTVVTGRPFLKKMHRISLRESVLKPKY